MFGLATSGGCVGDACVATAIMVGAFYVILSNTQGAPHASSMQHRHRRHARARRQHARVHAPLAPPEEVPTPWLYLYAPAA